MEKAYLTNISQRIIQNCNALDFDPDVDEIEGKLQRLIEEFGVQPSEAEKSVTKELIKKYESSPKKAKILKQISEYDLHNLDDFLSVTKPIDMDIHWLMTVASLSAQEIAIKRKLFELTGMYVE
jgi:DNA repair ATPase RecN